MWSVGPFCNASLRFLERLFHPFLSRFDGYLEDRAHYQSRKMGSFRYVLHCINLFFPKIHQRLNWSCDDVFLESSAINDVDGEEASRDLALFWFSKLQVLLQLQMPRCKGGCLKLHLVKCLAAAMHFTLMPSIKIPSASVVAKKRPPLFQFSIQLKLRMNFHPKIYDDLDSPISYLFNANIISTIFIMGYVAVNSFFPSLLYLPSLSFGSQVVS